MALTLNYNLPIDNSNGEAVFFSDITLDYGIGGNPTYADIQQCRFLCGNYPNTVITTSLSVGHALEKYRQYRLIRGGGQVYDNKTINAGDTYIPFTDNETVQLGDVFETTGYFSKYVAPATYLPTVSMNVFIMDTSYWGYSTAVFPSAVQPLQYEVYVTTSPDPLTNVTTDYQYIVTGTGSDTVIYNGNTYRVGEVFIASDNGVVTFTGTANLKILAASVFNYWIWIWELLKRYDEVVLSQENCGCSDNPALCQIWVLFFAMQNASFRHWVSATKFTENMPGS